VARLCADRSRPVFGDPWTCSRGVESCKDQRSRQIHVDEWEVFLEFEERLEQHIQVLLTLQRRGVLPTPLDKELLCMQKRLTSMKDRGVGVGLRGKLCRAWVCTETFVGVLSNKNVPVGQRPICESSRIARQPPPPPSRQLHRFGQRLPVRRGSFGCVPPQSHGNKIDLQRPPLGFPGKPKTNPKSFKQNSRSPRCEAPGRTGEVFVWVLRSSSVIFI